MLSLSCSFTIYIITGSIRDAGGSFGKMEQAQEEQYFRKLQQNQLKNMKSHHEEEIVHHEEEIKRHKDAIEHHKEQKDKIDNISK